MKSILGSVTVLVLFSIGRGSQHFALEGHVGGKSREISDTEMIMMTASS
jgi:hypothetical protein